MSKRQRLMAAAGTLTAAALAFAGAAVAMVTQGVTPGIDPVLATFSFASTDEKQRFCTGEDGPYVEILAHHEGTQTGDPRLTGDLSSRRTTSSTWPRAWARQRGRSQCVIQRRTRSRPEARTTAFSPRHRSSTEWRSARLRAVTARARRSRSSRPTSTWRRASSLESWAESRPMPESRPSSSVAPARGRGRRSKAPRRRRPSKGRTKRTGVPMRSRDLAAAAAGAIVATALAGRIAWAATPEGGHHARGLTV